MFRSVALNKYEVLAAYCVHSNNTLRYTALEKCKKLVQLIIKLPTVVLKLLEPVHALEY